MRYCLFLCAALALAVAASGPAGASTPAPAAARVLVPEVQLVGEGRYTVLFFDVFDAALHAPGGIYDPDKPFSLTLTYLRDFEGRKIAERSVKEIRAQGPVDAARLADWQRRMEAIFPDVREGMSLTGVRDTNGHAHFYMDGRLLGVIDDAAFSRRFFDIWLGEATDDRDLRARLVGRDEG